MQIHCLACHVLSVGCHMRKTVKTMNVCCIDGIIDAFMKLVSHHRQDPDFKKVIAWLETRSIPKVFPTNVSSQIKALWAQCDHLIMKNNVLYRQWQDAQGGGTTKRL